MKEHLVTFAVGAGVVMAAQYFNTYLNTAGTDGTTPAGSNTVLQNYGAALGGGLALVVAHMVFKKAA